MTVFLTGAAGNIGRRLAVSLTGRGLHVTCFDQSVPSSNLPGRWVQGSIVDSDAVSRAMRGASSVVHLGAISDPIAWELYPEILNANVTGTFTVLEAARKEGIKRIVLASSVCAIGLVSWAKPWAPDYLPLDERHPCRPDDNYGSTKLMTEILARGFHVRHEMEIVCLRFTGVFFPDSEASIDRYNQWLADPDGELVNRLWTYLRSEDAIEGIYRALVTPGLGFERILLAAPDSVVGECSLASLVERHFPTRLKDVYAHEAVSGRNASLVSTNHCDAVLGWRPQRSYRDVLAVTHAA